MEAKEKREVGDDRYLQWDKEKSRNVKGEKNKRVMRVWGERMKKHEYICVAL